MITEKGKAIIAKYMAGQTPAYGSYIAIGCGHNPGKNGMAVLDRSADQIDASEDSLEFEMMRTAVSSVSIVTENDGTSSVPDYTTKIVFSAELPTQSRYGITEVGLYPSEKNPIAKSDSRTLIDFSTSENWEYHTSELAARVENLSTSVLDANNNGSIDIDTGLDVPIFSSMADDAAFKSNARIYTKEQPRVSSDAIWIRGDTSIINYTDGVMSLGTNTSPNGNTHIHYVGKNIALDSNSSEDVLRLAFSVIKRNVATIPDPDKVYIWVQFASTETQEEGVEYASLQVVLDSANLMASDNHRQMYMVYQQKLGDLIKTAGFSWASTRVVKVHVSVDPGGSALASDYFVVLDGLRFENRYDQTINPLYGLVAYADVSKSVTVTGQATSTQNVAIVKGENENSYIQIKIPIGLAVV